MKEWQQGPLYTDDRGRHRLLPCLQLWSNWADWCRNTNMTQLFLSGVITVSSWWNQELNFRGFAAAETFDARERRGKRPTATVHTRSFPLQQGRLRQKKKKKQITVITSADWSKHKSSWNIFGYSILAIQQRKTKATQTLLRDELQCTSHMWRWRKRRGKRERRV